MTTNKINKQSSVYREAEQVAKEIRVIRNRFKQLGEPEFAINLTQETVNLLKAVRLFLECNDENTAAYWMKEVNKSIRWK